MAVLDVPDGDDRATRAMGDCEGQVNQVSGRIEELEAALTSLDADLVQAVQVGLAHMQRAEAAEIAYREEHRRARTAEEEAAARLKQFLTQVEIHNRNTREWRTALDKAEAERDAAVKALEEAQAKAEAWNLMERTCHSPECPRCAELRASVREPRLGQAPERVIEGALIEATFALDSSDGRNNQSRQRAYDGLAVLPKLVAERDSLREQARRLVEFCCSIVGPVPCLGRGVTDDDGLPFSDEEYETVNRLHRQHCVRCRAAALLAEIEKEQG